MTRRGFHSSAAARRFRHAIEALEERRLLDANALIGLDLFRLDPRFAGIDGSGYSVVVIDHGADVNHFSFGPDLDSNGVADRIVLQHDFGDNDADAGEDSVIGHGTSVAGIIASQDPTHPGVAPGCNLIILKLFATAPGAESPDLTDLESALQWVEAHVAQYNIAAVNLSITDEENYSTPQNGKVTSDEFARLAALGVIVVAAAGNDFLSMDSVSGIGYPASDPNVIAVSGVWADNYGLQDFSGAINTITAPDHIAAFSQRHPTLTDIFAPAGNMITAANGGGITTRRGTSFAAPYVAGAAVLAQHLAVEELGRRLTVEEFRTKLKTTGVLINDGDDEVDNVVNTGADYRRLNILSLGESLLVHPGLPVVSISDVTVNEGNSGTTPAIVVVQISRATRAPITVQYATADLGASLADNDYVQTTGTLTFAPDGPLTQIISVPIVGDTRHEPTETFRVVLSGVTNAAVLNPTATITILANDVPRPWQNQAQPLDVNGSGLVTSLDALIIINRLNSTGPEVLPLPPPAESLFFYDVTGDGLVTALDALRVINHLNSVAGGQLNGASLEAAGFQSPTQEMAQPLYALASRSESSDSQSPQATATLATAAAGRASSVHSQRSTTAIQRAAWHFWAEYEAERTARTRTTDFQVRRLR
ncbi:MAG: S8 family serine peptidase [Pirellulales bacterium]